MASEQKRLGFVLDAETYMKLRLHCLAKGCAMQPILKQAVTMYLEQVSNA
jgi:hypothetical protein